MAIDTADEKKGRRLQTRAPPALTGEAEVRGGGEQEREVKAERGEGKGRVGVHFANDIRQLSRCPNAKLCITVILPFCIILMQTRFPLANMQTNAKCKITTSAAFP